MVECPDCEAGVQFFSFNIKTRQFVKVTKVAFQILPLDEVMRDMRGRTIVKETSGDVRPAMARG